MLGGSSNHHLRDDSCEQQRQMPDDESYDESETQKIKKRRERISAVRVGAGDLRCDYLLNKAIFCHAASSSRDL